MPGDQADKGNKRRGRQRPEKKYKTIQDQHITANFSHREGLAGQAAKAFEDFSHNHTTAFLSTLSVISGSAQEEKQRPDNKSDGGERSKTARNKNKKAVEPHRKSDYFDKLDKAVKQHQPQEVKNKKPLGPQSSKVQKKPKSKNNKRPHQSKEPILIDDEEQLEVEDRGSGVRVYTEEELRNNTDFDNYG